MGFREQRAVAGVSLAGGFELPLEVADPEHELGDGDGVVGDFEAEELVRADLVFAHFEGGVAAERGDEFEDFRFEPFQVFEGDIEEIGGAAGRVEHPDCAEVAVEGGDELEGLGVLLFRPKAAAKKKRSRSKAERTNLPSPRISPKLAAGAFWVTALLLPTALITAARCDGNFHAILLVNPADIGSDFTAPQPPVLNPDNGLCQLILDKEPGRVYEARLTSGFSFDRAVRNSCTFDLEFFCPDPYGYAISDETFDFSEAGTFTASRALGNIESFPVYSLKGVIPSGTDSYISITTNGSELQIIGQLASGETLIIDSDLMTAKVVDDSGETLRNGLPLLSELNFPVLNTGDNSIVIAAVGTNTTFTELTIQARSRWR